MSEKTPSRRQFLQNGTATVAATTLASTIATKSYAASDDTIKAALIGCGGRGTGAAAQFLATSYGPVKLHAMADAFSDRLEASHKNLTQKGAKTNNGGKAPGEELVDVPPERRFTGFDAYKRAIDSGVDMVILTTPPGFRPLHLEYAVAQGKNVFMEKPVATDAAGINRVIAAAAVAKQKGLKIGVGLQRHHQAKYQEGIQRINNGEIGDVSYMRVYWNGGGVWTRPRQEGMNEMQFQMLNWYYFNWLCGDHITEQHIHNIDIGNWVMGGPPVKAEGMGGRQVRTDNVHGEIYDHHAVEFTYADGRKVISQCRHIKGCTNSVSEHAHGSKGYANLSGGSLYSDQAGTKRIWSYRDKAAPNPYQVEHDDLQEAIRNNLDYNEAAYGASSTMTSILGRLATYSGKVVGYQQALASNFSLAPGIDNYTYDTVPPIVPNEDGSYPVAMPGTYKAY